MAKLSASGEWLVADSDVPTAGPVELKLNTKLRPGMMSTSFRAVCLPNCTVKQKIQ